MNIVRFFDSCFTAAYKAFNSEQQSVSNATLVLVAVFMFYWVDIVSFLNDTGVLSELGWRGKNLVFFGGVLILFTNVLIYLPRGPKILNDKSLTPPPYRFLRYVFFYSPLLIFFAIIFLGIRFPRY